MNDKIVILIPNYRWLHDEPGLALPIAIPILTRLLKDVCSLTIIDANGANYSEDKCKELLRELQPKAVFLTTMYFVQQRQAIKATALVKSVSPEIITIMGGVFVTITTRSAISDPNLDYAVIGHAEERIENITRFVIEDKLDELKKTPGIAYRNDKGEKIIVPLTSSIKDLAEIAQPDYSLIDLSPYIRKENKYYQTEIFEENSFSILTSYGCPFGCAFCCRKSITGNAIRMRSPEMVLDEIETLISTYGVRNFTIVDDLFLFKKERAKAILNMIIERKLDIKLVIENEFEGFFDEELIDLLARAGCITFGIAIEAGNLRVLKKYTNKPVKYEHAQQVAQWAKNAGIMTIAKWIIGFPDETWEEIRDTFKRAEEIGCDYNQFSIATPLPGTALTQMYIDQGSLPKDFDFDTQNIVDTRNYRGGYISTPEFNAKELQILRCYEWDRINFSSHEKRIRIAKLMHMTENDLEAFRKAGRKEALHLITHGRPF